MILFNPKYSATKEILKLILSLYLYYFSLLCNVQSGNNISQVPVRPLFLFKYAKSILLVEMSYVSSSLSHHNTL